MSFLAGRLAATEGAYFLHESKNVVSRHAQKLPPTPLPSLPVAAEARSKIADVLPEILRHDVPLKGISTADASSLSASSKWLVRGSSSSSSSSMVSPDSLNPLRAYVSLPQATFGPKRCGPEFKVEWSCGFGLSSKCKQGQMTRFVLPVLNSFVFEN
ncbi:hypothetical protein ZIOFF_028379 [Zingiber officinale]|uniref:Uncharacterized protein n=1 Tax=Zingiber officinale TaxID=94328 RepID=A0A8J5GVS4_ZINOF|nr:hypothetical protein ZIOFF_028379 [Zingiber officinale]